jgi:signal transduction histidine kinase
LTIQIKRRSAGESAQRWDENPLARIVARVPVRIRTKLLAAFAAMVLLLLGVGVLGQRVLSQSNDRLEALARLQKNLTVYRLLQNDNIALQQVVGSRVGGDVEAFAGQLATPMRENVEPILRRLRDYYDFSRLDFDPSAEERRVLRRIEADYERFVSAMTRSVDLDERARVAAAEELVITEAKPLLTRLGRATDQLANEAEARIAAMTGENRAAFVTSRTIFVLSAAGAIVLAVLFGFAISSSLTGPVRRIDTRLGEIASGDFGGRVEVPNRDELGTLAFHLNRMSDELARLYHVVESQAAALRDWNATLEARVTDQAEELRASRARIVATADAERRRIERDLHDGAQQHLVALAVNLRLARSELADGSDVAAMLDRLVADVRALIEELRDLAHGIYPPLLRDSGLGPALQAAANRTNLPVSVLGAVGRHPPEVETAVYFCCLEALQNTAKYAPGASATIRLWEDGEMLSFEVGDDGPGFDPATVRAGQGLMNIMDRISAVGGEVDWISAVGEGTRVSGSVPVAGPARVTPELRPTPR